MQPIKLGKYRHFRNHHIYEVIGCAKHSETLEDLVVYIARYKCDQYGENSLWVRPLSMFTETVLHEGQQVKRFQYIGD